MISYRDIVAALPSLSQRELKELRARCQLLVQQSGVSAQPIADEDWLFLGIIHELKRRNLYVPIGARVSKAGSYGSFTTVSTDIRRLLEQAAPGLNAVQLRALGQVAANALADYLSIRDVSFQGMLRYASLTPTAIETQFPGYMESRLLGLTIGFQNGG